MVTRHLFPQGVSAPGDQLQRGARGGLSLPRRLLRLQQPPPGAGDPGGERVPGWCRQCRDGVGGRILTLPVSAAGVAGGVPAVPGEEPGAGRAAQPKQFPLQDHRLPGLVHLRGFGQRVSLPHLPGPQLPALQGEPLPNRSLPSASPPPPQQRGLGGLAAVLSSAISHPRRPSTKGRTAANTRMTCRSRHRTTQLLGRPTTCCRWESRRGTGGQ